MSKYVLNELLTNGLELVYAAHHQGAAQADANLRSSTFPELRATLEAGVKKNRDQARRLEKVFKLLGLTPKGTPDQAMQGIIDTNNTLIAQTSNPTERDLINIASAQHAAHFYLAAYGPLRHYAKELGRSEAASLLQKTLDETGEINKTFTDLSVKVIKHSNHHTRSKSEGGLLRTTIPAFFAVGLVGTAITLASKSAPSPNAD
jgi:ferritin-like metal-binding protein YciE